MPATQNLQQTVNWCAPFINYQPLLIGGQEPALTCANLVLQSILGPPMCWRFNRATAQFLCVADGTFDYTVQAPLFGFVEKVWLTDPNGEIKEIENKTVLAASSNKDRSGYIAAQSDDGAGNVTFRLMPAPNKTYQVTVLYQQKAPLLQSLASLWAPVPDEFGYVYQWGFLALTSLLVDDVRFPIYMQKFMSHLLGAQDGLDELQRNIYVGNFLELAKMAERGMMKAKQGVLAQGQ